MSATYLINAAIKGVIEGFTEFLPISSTGHLVLVRNLFPLTDPANAENTKRLNEVFDIVVQFPAVLAIVLLFRKRLWNSVTTIRERDSSMRLWLGLVIAFVPLAVTGLLFHKYLEEHLAKPVPIAIALILGGVVLLLIEKALSVVSVQQVEDVPLPTAFQIGLFQCLALFPGTSRSAATIIGGRLKGLSRTAAAEFSFFLALPTIGAAFGLKLFREYKSIDWASDGLILAIGCVTSFITAWIVVALFIKILEKYSMAMFGWYRIALGIIVLLVAKHL